MPGEMRYKATPKGCLYLELISDKYPPQQRPNPVYFNLSDTPEMAVMRLLASDTTSQGMGSMVCYFGDVKYCAEINPKWYRLYSIVLENVELIVEKLIKNGMIEAECINWFNL
jgi:hypothetical protein